MTENTVLVKNNRDEILAGDITLIGALFAEDFRPTTVASFPSLASMHAVAMVQVHDANGAFVGYIPVYHT